MDFTRLVVDNHEILNEPKSVWQDIPFNFLKNVENGDLISIHVE